MNLHLSCGGPFRLLHRYQMRIGYQRRLLKGIIGVTILLLLIRRSSPVERPLDTEVCVVMEANVGN